MNDRVREEMAELDDGLDGLPRDVSDRIDDLLPLDRDDDDGDPLSAEMGADVPADGRGLPSWIDFVEL